MSKQVALQRVDRYTLKAFSEEDADELADFPTMKILNAKITGALKPRSYEQLQTFWCACRTVANNTQDSNWNTPEKVAEQVKIKCQYIKSYIVVDGAVHIVTGSISYASMGHMDACRFMDRAFEEMAKHLGITVDELLSNSKA